MQADMIQVLKRLLLSPATPLEFMVSALLALFVFVLVLNKVGTAMDLKVAQTGQSLVVLAVTLVAGLALVVVAGRHVPLPGWGAIAAGVAVVVLVGAPVTVWVQKGGYFGALTALLFSIAAAMVVVTLVHTIFGAFGKGEQSVGRGLDHNRETQRFLNQ
ncbi:MAG: hypothetical protein K8T26_10740 [Lentisphaerae bacterium]|nr:hypothetical protein [Lentisphaerota bacterium]